RVLGDDERVELPAPRLARIEECEQELAARELLQREVVEAGRHRLAADREIDVRVEVGPEVLAEAPELVRVLFRLDRLLVLVLPDRLAEVDRELPGARALPEVREAGARARGVDGERLLRVPLRRGAALLHRGDELLEPRIGADAVE